MVLLLQLIPSDHTDESNLENFLISTTFVFYALFWKLPASPVVCRKVDDVDGGAGLPCALGPLEAIFLSLLTVYLFLLHRPENFISEFDGV